MGNFLGPEILQDASAMSRRFMTQRSITQRLQSFKPPRALLAALIMLAFFVAVAAPGTAFALHRVDRRHRFLRHLRGILWHPMFRPSHDSLIRQNEEIDRIDLPRIQDDAELEALKASGALVPIEETESLKIERGLDPSRRFCRPWTRDFITDLSEVYYRQFHAQIQVNSAVRTVKGQKKLRRHNRNAAPEKGETASSHLAGITVDIQRRGMSREQVKWMENYMMPLKELGLIEPEEERHQWVFHVAVSGHYTDWRESRMLAGESSSEEDSTVTREMPASIQ